MSTKILVFPLNLLICWSKSLRCYYKLHIYSKITVFGGADSFRITVQTNACQTTGIYLCQHHVQQMPVYCAINRLLSISWVFLHANKMDSVTNESSFFCGVCCVLGTFTSNTPVKYLFKSGMGIVIIVMTNFLHDCYPFIRLCTAHKTYL